jgi:hypothetical protein
MALKGCLKGCSFSGAHGLNWMVVESRAHESSVMNLMKEEHMNLMKVEHMNLMKVEHMIQVS